MHDSALKLNFRQNLSQQSTLVRGRFFGTELFNTIGRKCPPQLILETTKRRLTTQQVIDVTKSLCIVDLVYTNIMG